MLRFGLLEVFRPFPEYPLAPDSNADWFAHLRKGLWVSKALPRWLVSGEIGGLRLNDRATRRVERARRGPLVYRDRAPTVAEELRLAGMAVAGELIQAAPIILALIAEAARAHASSLEHRPPQPGARPDMFRRELFRGLAIVHRDMFGVLPRIRDNERERRGPSVGWIGRILRCAAKRAEARDYPGGADLRELAKESAETLARHLQTASTGIQRAAPNSSAGTE